MTESKTDIETFIKLAGEHPVVDVRSPSEFRKGHIPGSFNIPLFDDAERDAVGKKYAKGGRVKAILAGLELTGPKMHSKLEIALKTAGGGPLLVHCWRGGMRSEAMAWLFSIGGIKTCILEGGYKSYRRYVTDTLSSPRKIIILGGLTGSGKTRILKFIAGAGHQVIDLEKLANHKGSAFGSLGQLPQPASEYFSNLLFEEIRKTDPSIPLWIEDESSNIGNVFLPDEFWRIMQKSPSIALLMDAGIRLPNLVKEYASFPSEELIDIIMKISRRMGNDNARNAAELIRSGNLEEAVRIVLDYYDKAYLYNLGKKKESIVHYINTDTDDARANALNVLDAAGRIAWQ